METQGFFSRPDHGGYPAEFLRDELAKANEKMKEEVPKVIPSGESFSIISFQDNPKGSKIGTEIRPHSVMRTWDKEVFTIGDTVTNGTQMVGEITGFDLLEGQIFVKHTWSGIGMNLDSLSKIIDLPSRFRVRQVVKLIFNPENPLTATIRAVHFFIGKVKYDVDVWVGKGGNDSTRIYNVDSVYIEVG